jgi:hypothetical protein
VGPSPPPFTDQPTCTTSFRIESTRAPTYPPRYQSSPDSLFREPSINKTSIDIQTSIGNRRNRLGSKRHLVNLNGSALAHACLICSLPQSNPANNLQFDLFDSQLDERTNPPTFNTSRPPWPTSRNPSSPP